MAAATATMASLGFVERGFASGEIDHPVFEKGSGPSVLVRLIDAGFRVHLPLLVGAPLRHAALANWRALCISAEFARLEAGIHAPITDWLRALAADIAERADGARIGAIGMCLTGAFVIPLLIDAAVTAGVVSQPAIPLRVLYRAFGLGAGPWMDQLNISDDELQVGARAARSNQKKILLQRYADDRLCPGQRLKRIARSFGSQARLYEYSHPSWWRRVVDPPHALLTEEYDRAGEDDQATREALRRVIQLLNEQLARQQG
jgi:dienelactone hydrolase